MRKNNSPTIIEVGKQKTVVAQRRGSHLNIVIRPTAAALRRAAIMARYEYGAGSQTERSILARLNS